MFKMNSIINDNRTECIVLKVLLKGNFHALFYVTVHTLTAILHSGILRDCESFHCENTEDFKFIPLHSLKDVVERMTEIHLTNLRKMVRNAAFDLVGIESNPGPDPKTVTTTTVTVKPSNQQNQKKNNGNNKKKKNNNNRNNISVGPKTGITDKAGQYLRSVLQPCSGNARIPDYNCTPTALVTLQQFVVLGISGGGVGGLKFSLDPYTRYYSENLATTSDAAITYNAATGLSGTSAFTTNYSFARLVSACLDIEFLGTTLTDSGLVIGVSLGAFNSSPEILPLTSDSCLSCRVVDSHRFANGMSVFFRPNDSSSFDFATPNSGASNRWGALIIHISGAASTATYRAKMTMNWECMPLYGTVSNSMPQGSYSPSPVDPVGHAQAVNVISTVKPIMTLARAEKITSDLSNLATTGRGIWNYVSAIFSGARSAGKLLL